MPLAAEGKELQVLLYIALGLLAWLALSVAVTPLLGGLMRDCDVEEERNSIPVLRAKAQQSKACR